MYTHIMYIYIYLYTTKICMYIYIYIYIHNNWAYIHLYITWMLKPPTAPCNDEDPSSKHDSKNGDSIGFNGIS